MRLSAIDKLTDELVEIKGVSEIHEDNFTYYISGKYDPRCLTTDLLTEVICLKRTK